MKKISAIAKIYARRIKENNEVVTIDDVPEKWKGEVMILLSEEAKEGHID